MKLIQAQKIDKINKIKMLKQDCDIIDKFDKSLNVKIYSIINLGLQFDLGQYIDKFEMTSIFNTTLIFNLLF